MQLILLAAGMGNRLPKYLRKDPKCMVKINNKCVIEYLEEFTKKFKNKTIITGYKSYKLKEIIKKLNLNEIRNNHYKKTNMVYSMFRAKNILKKEIVICYTDIIFDPKIFEKNYRIYIKMRQLNLDSRSKNIDILRRKIEILII